MNMKDTTAILMLLSPGFSSLTLPATSQAGVCYLGSQIGNHPAILLDFSVDRKTGFQSNRYPCIPMSVLSSWVPESSCPTQHNEGVGVSMQLGVKKSKAVLEVSMLLQGPPSPQSHLPSSGLQSPPPDWETSRSSAHSHMFLPSALCLCSPSQQDFLLISRKLQAGARGQESLGENTRVFSQHLPLPTNSAGPEQPSPTGQISHRTALQQR